MEQATLSLISASVKYAFVIHLFPMVFAAMWSNFRLVNPPKPINAILYICSWNREMLSDISLIVCLSKTFSSTLYHTLNLACEGLDKNISSIFERAVLKGEISSVNHTRDLPLQHNSTCYNPLLFIVGCYTIPLPAYTAKLLRHAFALPFGYGSIRHGHLYC